mmetsp:Transcript_1770/g.2037  ORF Transcript_1770/g.2037 Transcript_1770/m.2037 type:complete len:138 (-) Transcript_1770:138-551(-)
MADVDDGSLFALVARMVEEEVDKLATCFKLDGALKEELGTQMKQRSATLTEDVRSLAEVLEGSKTPADHVRTAIRQMREGTFGAGAVPEGRSTNGRSRSRSAGRSKPQRSTRNRPLAQGEAPAVGSARPMTLLERFG